MSPEPESFRRRQDESVRLGRDLAVRLAAGAERIASILDDLAAVHESVAEVRGHPLAGQAVMRAASERRMAARERAASIWFRSIADGSYRPRAKPSTYRLPSQ